MGTKERRRYSSATEADLVMWAQRDDNEAMAELFIRYRRPLTFIAVGIAGADGEDALMEVMCTFVQRVKSYDPSRGRFGAWLKRVTANQAHTMVKARAQRERTARRASCHLRGRVVHVPGDETGLDIVTMADNPEDRVSHRAALCDGLGLLGERERYVLVASAFLGLSDDEIASVLAVSSTTVRTIRHKARAKLAKSPEDAEVGLTRGRVA